MILATPLVLRGLVTLLCYQDSTKNCFVRVWLKNVFASKNKNIKRTVIFPTLPKAIKVPWQLSFLRLFSLFGYFGFLFNYALSLFKIGFLFLVFLGYVLISQKDHFLLFAGIVTSWKSYVNSKVENYIYVTMSIWDLLAIHLLLNLILVVRFNSVKKWLISI